MKDAVDVKTNPCEDFYEFACGKWDQEHSDAIPAYKSQVAFAWDRADKSIRTEMTKLLEEDTGPAGLYFRSCMDLEHIEDIGTTQLDPWIKYVDAISDKASMVTAITEFNKHDMDNFFTWGIDTDNRDSSRKSFSIQQGGMTLPDNTYYLEDSKVMRQHREMMKQVVAKFFVKIGRADTADAEAQMILDFETKFAGIRVDRAESRKDQGTPTTWEHVDELMPYWPWKQWLQELGSCTAPPDGSAKVCTHDHDKVRLVGGPGETPLYISNEAFFPKLNALLESVSAQLQACGCVHDDDADACSGVVEGTDRGMIADRPRHGESNLALEDHPQSGSLHALVLDRSHGRVERRPVWHVGQESARSKVLLLHLERRPVADGKALC